MHTTWVVFRKELLDTLRDRRTLLMAIVLPLVIFPLILAGFVMLQATQTQQAEQRLLTVGLASHGNAEAFREHLEQRGDVRLVPDIPSDSARSWVRHDSLDAAFLFDPSFDRQVAEREAGALTLVYESGGDMLVLQRRLRTLVDEYRQELLEERLSSLNLAPSALETIALEEEDVATTREALGRMVGGFLPYIFLLFCFLGAMYPAIDLGAGEKERATMETLLTSPARRLEIVLGKFGVITLAGVLSAIISVLGLFLGLQLIPDLPAELRDVLGEVMRPDVVLLELSLLVPLTMFFAGVQLTLSLYAKSFKEAQSILSPLSIAVLLPAIIGILPGMELTPLMALIPVLNVSLATKEVVAGTMAPELLLLTYGSLLVLAAGALWLSVLYFGREDVIFRT